MKKTFYVTTPIYYASGNLHIGHLYSTTLAYALANYKKLQNYDVKFLTGSDEHGQKIETKAELNNITPKQFIEKNTASFINLWKKMDIEYDFFSRTTNKFHKDAVRKQFISLENKGIIYKGFYKGLYSIEDEEFLTEYQAVKRDGKWYHPTSHHLLTCISEETYFLKISKFQKWIKEFLEKTSVVVPKKSVKELVNNFINNNLRDLSITRTTFKWGIPISSSKKHVLYVWLDALNNYITALGYNGDDDSNFKKYWKNGDEIVHVIGKEIIRFHCIYWPIILKALDLRQPTNILVHGWIIGDEGKMSKSKGNVINPLKLLEKFDPEVIKFYLATHMNQFEDSIFSEELLLNSYNSDLANNIGNLVNRTIKMINSNFDRCLIYKKTKIKDDIKIEKQIIESRNKYIKQFDNFEINKSLNEAIVIGKHLNKYIDLTEPWKLKNDKDRLEQVLIRIANGIYAIATYLSVVMPKNMKKILELLNWQEFDLNLIDKFDKFKAKFNDTNVLFKRQ